MKNLIAVKSGDKTIYFPVNMPMSVSDEYSSELDTEYCPPQSLHSNYDEGYCIYLTDKCNLRCVYCFEQFEHDSSNLKSHTNVTPEDFVTYLKKRSKKKYFIRFFGGEPLLNKKGFFSYLYALEEYSKQMGVEFIYTLFTNGTLLDEDTLEILKRLNIVVYISFDGSELLQNRNRDNSYSLVKDSISKLANAHIRTIGYIVYSLDTNIHLWDCIKNSIDLGIEAVVFNFPWSDGKHGKYDLNAGNLDKALDEIDLVKNEYIKMVTNGIYKYLTVHPLITNLNQWINNTAKLENECCAAGWGYFAVNCQGELYPCQTLEGITKFKLGTIYDMHSESNQMQTCFDKFPACIECSINWICRYRCLADNYFVNKDIYAINELRCAVQKKLLEASIDIFYTLTRSERNIQVLRFWASRPKAKKLQESR